MNYKPVYEEYDSPEDFGDSLRVDNFTSKLIENDKMYSYKIGATKAHLVAW